MPHEIFADEFLDALGAWQRGWGEQRDRRLALTVALQAAIARTPLPDIARTAEQVCYRKRFLYKDNPENGGDHVPILLHGSYDEGLASWTTDFEYAKAHKGDLRENANTAIFGRLPMPDEVILNIKELWALPEFQSAIDDYRQRGGIHSDALLNFKDLQSEVILDAPLRTDDIESFCNVIGSFEELFALAGVTPETEEAFVEKLKDADALPGGAFWLPKEASQRVVKATIRTFQLKHGIAG